MTIKLTNEIFEQHYVDATDVDKATSSDSYFTFNYILKNMYVEIFQKALYICRQYIYHVLSRPQRTAPFSDFCGWLST